MNFICTWLCADEKGEESLFPQTGKVSSSREHQEIYWRCLLVFFITSKRFNKTEKHVLFTNVGQLPVVDGKKMKKLLDDLEVEVVFTDFSYKTPKGYYGAFQNQFYEFSVLQHISLKNNNPKDQYLVLDSDCIFLKPVDALFEEAREQGFISFRDDVLPDYTINGLSRNDMKMIYEELLERPLGEIPSYHLGEFLLCSVENVKKIFADFSELWPQLLERHRIGQKKFNEEAHTLSYLYYKNGFKPATDNKFMKRIWTNPLFYRNVEPTDTDLAIWHLPAEKTFGLRRLYDSYLHGMTNYGFDISNRDFIQHVRKTLGVPDLGLRMRSEYYILSYYRALKKRMRRHTALKK